MRAAALAIAVAALAGCGGHKAQTPEQVARAWSAALDRSDDTGAAKLFAANAEIVQNGVTVLRGRTDAVAWNRALPCGGRILSVLAQARDEVLVVFKLTERPGHICDGPDQTAAAVFQVVHGKITLWHQVPPPAPGQTV